MPKESSQLIAENLPDEYFILYLWVLKIGELNALVHDYAHLNWIPCFSP